MRALLTYLSLHDHENGISSYDGAQSEKGRGGEGGKEGNETRSKRKMRHFCSCLDKHNKEKDEAWALGEHKQTHTLIFLHKDCNHALLSYLCAMISTVMFPCEIIRSMDCWTVYCWWRGEEKGQE